MENAGMSWYALDALDDAFDETEQLFLPFDADLWIQLAIVMFFLGYFGDIRYPDFHLDFNYRQAITAGFQVLPGMPLEAAYVNAVPRFFELMISPALVYFAANSVMEFIFVDIVVKRDIELLPETRRVLKPASQLFVFRIILFTLVAVPVFTTIAPRLRADESQIGVFLGLYFVLAVAWLVDTLTRDFVVPVMVSSNEGILDGWRSFWPIVHDQWKQFVLYLFIRTGFGVFAALAITVTTSFLFAGAASALTLVFQPGGFEAPVLPLLLLYAEHVLFVVVAGTVLLIPMRTYLRYLSLLVLEDANETFDLLRDS